MRIRYEVKFLEKKWNEITTTYCMTLENCWKYNPISIRKVKLTKVDGWYRSEVLEVIK